MLLLVLIIVGLLLWVLVYCVSRWVVLDVGWWMISVLVLVVCRVSVVFCSDLFLFIEDLVVLMLIMLVFIYLFVILNDIWVWVEFL